jgi:hypothetical protein
VVACAVVRTEEAGELCRLAAESKSGVILLGATSFEELVCVMLQAVYAESCFFFLFEMSERVKSLLQGAPCDVIVVVGGTSAVGVNPPGDDSADEKMITMRRRLK